MPVVQEGLLTVDCFDFFFIFIINHYFGCNTAISIFQRKTVVLVDEEELEVYEIDHADQVGRRYYIDI